MQREIMVASYHVDRQDSMIAAAIARRATERLRDAQDGLAAQFLLHRAQHQQGAVLGNLASHELRLLHGPPPREGAWAVPPSPVIPAMPAPAAALAAWKASGDAPATAMPATDPGALNDGLQHMLAIWIEQSLPANPAGMLGLKSRGGGVEGAVVYQVTGVPLTLAVYLSTQDQGESMLAGAAMLGLDEMQSQLARDDAKLSDLCARIRAGEGEAAGLSRGDTCVLRKGDARISFRAGPQVTFLLAGDLG